MAEGVSSRSGVRTMRQGKSEYTDIEVRSDDSLLSALFGMDGCMFKWASMDVDHASNESETKCVYQHPVQRILMTITPDISRGCHRPTKASNFDLPCAAISATNSNVFGFSPTLTLREHCSLAQRRDSSTGRRTCMSVGRTAFRQSILRLLYTFRDE